MIHATALAPSVGGRWRQIAEAWLVPEPPAGTNPSIHTGTLP
ncbi:hypothetical protein SAMN05518801_10112 [Novosphingobium sp. CF614]|nr:hypothetical protein [Novosphingobium sp. CF614]SFF72911.1 hypothetical protein SAMN05518801_10112 [Novosphingobium sp. CF614]